MAIYDSEISVEFRGVVNKVLYGEAPPRRPTQANSFNTGNEGAIENFRINRVMLFK